jgi:hypothetical protein
MIGLTRHQQDRHQECWKILYGDVCVGTIGERTGGAEGC